MAILEAESIETYAKAEDRASMIFDYEKAQELMNNSNVDAMVIHTTANLSYIMDYSYPLAWPDFLLEDGISYYNAFICIPRGGAEDAFVICCAGERGDIGWKDPWISDRRFWGPQFHVSGKAASGELNSNPVKMIAASLIERGLSKSRIGLETQHIKNMHFVEFKELMPDALFVDIEPILWQLRMIKSQEEISRMRVASRAVSKAAEVGFGSAMPGMTEEDMERIVAKTIIDNGCKFEWLEIGFGSKGAYMINPTTTRLCEGHIIRMDIGARYKGYISDFSRVSAFGKAGERAEWAHSIILHVNEVMREAIRPGVACSEINKLAFGMLKKEGLKPLSPMAGHGVGRSVHEPPFLTAQSDMILKPGMVIAAEPTIRLAGIGSIAIEDMVVITETGCECLTTAARVLYI